MDTKSSEVSTLEQRVQELERQVNNSNKNLLSKISLWGGILALTMSIMIACFQLYEFTIIKTRESLEKKSSTLTSYIRRVTEINTALSKKALLADNPEKMAQLAIESKIINGEKMSVVRLATNLLDDNPEIGRFPFYLTLSYELLSQGDNIAALKMARLAFQTSRTSWEKMESMRYMAYITFVPGSTQNIPAARELFQEAIELAISENNHVKHQLIANSYANWISAEVLFGSCEKAKNTLSDFSQLMIASEATPILKNTLIEVGFSTRGQNRCNNILSNF
ncbi:hypothetical protein MTR11_21640 [Vibrio sp. CCB-PB317]|uniref:hypothetical protein n=1 Tax=Vibrio sp. CCB-PB317 TaxID=2929171 RepID=UPI001FADCB5D|nr:hypothetical protein [Vibrio sp. CCB-PB317]MCJ0884286.1 hypothetical protein [Vibrio sp. CCB-PB317]